LVTCHSELQAAIKQVVLMSTPLAISFGRLLTQLDKFLRANTAALTPDGEFACHVYAAAAEKGPLPADPPTVHPDALRAGHAPSLAAAGYCLARLPNSTLHAIAVAWADGLTRLSGKEAFPADHQSFAFRPLEVLGIVQGVRSAPAVSPPCRKWLEGVLGRLERDGCVDYWSRSINATAARLLGVSWRPVYPPALAEMRLDELALGRWLSVAYPMTGLAAAPNLPDVHKLDGELLKRAIETAFEPQDIARVSVLHHAIRRAVSEHIESQLERTWQVGRETQDALQIVENLCRRFHLFAKQILTRHDTRPTVKMTDEYDVQDAIHALLRLHFDDVRPEEWTPSYAGKSTRMDFLLKREQVVVEVKMTRKGLDQKEVVKQLTEDKERYRVHPDCRALICFVYDPAGICENPNALEQDVAVREGKFRVLVIVAPKGT
jgi:hypothetical protein